MCAGIFYLYQGQDYRYYFQNPKATLPVLRKDGSIALIPWGRRSEQTGALPLGGHAMLDSIYAGRWDRFFPKPVKLPITSFMEYDFEQRPKWFDIITGQWIQGLLVREKHEQRVYIVCIEPMRDDACFAKWPRVMHDGR